MKLSPGLSALSRIGWLGLAVFAIHTHAVGANYGWTNFVGQPGGKGNADGPGSDARFNRPFGVAVDGAGNLYVGDYFNHMIRKVTPVATAGVTNWVVTTLAGDFASYGNTDGTGKEASFKSPCGVALDTAGNLYVADLDNQTIRKVTPEVTAGVTNWVVTTLVGSPGVYGTADGTGSVARFYFPYNLAVDSNGNVFVADSSNHAIRKVTPVVAEGVTNWVVTTVAGSPGVSGTANGTNNTARFYQPRGIALDNAGNVYVGDSFNRTIRKVTPVGTNWVVKTLAGSAGLKGSTDGSNSVARFNFPLGMALDSAGNVYVSDPGNYNIRKMTPVGANWVVTTLAGSAGNPGSVDGTNNAARFNNCADVAVDNRGNVYVADMYSYAIRKVTPVATAGVTNWVVSTLAGSPQGGGSANGTGTTARLGNPYGVAIGRTGTVFVADSGNYTIRRVSPSGVVTTLAGSNGVSGVTDGTGSAARFYFPSGVTVDNADNVFVADTYNNTIRKVTAAGVVTTLVGAGNGSADGTNRMATFSGPQSAVLDSAGNLYVADTGNHTIRKVTPVGANWVVTTLAGSPGLTGSTDGTNNAARFDHPYGVAVDSSGQVFVADTFNNTLRKMTAVGTNWVVTTLAGSTNAGSADGTGSAAQFRSPIGLAVDNAGHLFVTESGNHTIRRVSAAGEVTTIGGVPGVIGGTDGVGAAALFNGPGGITVDGAGTLFVADTYNNRITKGAPLPWTVTQILTGNGTANPSETLFVADGASTSILYTAAHWNRIGSVQTNGGAVAAAVGAISNLLSLTGVGGDLTNRVAFTNATAEQVGLPDGVAVSWTTNYYVTESAAVADTNLSLDYLLNQNPTNIYDPALNITDIAVSNASAKISVRLSGVQLPTAINGVLQLQGATNLELGGWGDAGGGAISNAIFDGDGQAAPIVIPAPSGAGVYKATIVP
jgi:hypothetical protein